MRFRSKSTGNDVNMDEIERQDVIVPLKNWYVKLTCVNMFVFGLESTISAGFSYLPPMLLKAGFGEVAMTWIMGIGPFMALLTVPCLGRWSDRCESKWGRRTPFISGISMLLVVSLLFITFGHLIPSLTIFLLVLGSVLLNYACQAGLNPCESIVADVTANTSHEELGFTIYSVMVSLGCCAGYIITAFDYSNTPFNWLFQSSERTAFAFVLILLSVTIVLTLMVTVKKSKRRKLSFATSVDTSVFTKDPSRNYEDVGYESAENDSQDEVINNNYQPTSLTAVSCSSNPEKCPYKSYNVSKWCLPFRRIHCCFFQVFRNVPLNLCVPNFLWKGPTKFVRNCAESIHNFTKVPPVLRLLFVSDLCSWTAIMCQLMYYTDYIGQGVYGGNPNAREGSSERHLYDAGVRMGSFGLLLHGILSTVYACTVQKVLFRCYGCRTVYFSGLVIFTFAMFVTLVSKDIVIINLMAAVSGAGFAATTTVPYMLISAYHAQPQIYFSKYICTKEVVFVSTKEISNDKLVVDVLSEERRELCSEEEDEDVDEERGYGTDIAVLDVAYFLAQTFLSVFIGYIVDITHSVTAYIAVAAFFGVLSCYCTTRVIFPPRT